MVNPVKIDIISLGQTTLCGRDLWYENVRITDGMDRATCLSCIAVHSAGRIVSR